MYSLQALEEAIIALESHQDALSADVAELALAALRRKLAELQTALDSRQLVQVTILVADLSGFTAMSEFMDAEEVRDTINAVWQKLDGAITAWGGQVDKHVGDAIIALFGVPHAGEDDAERAVQAALDMQMALAQINELTLQKITGNLRGRHQLQMRIGIHSGPVFMGAVGASGEFTAVGDTVMTANQLEKLAPVGGILISHDVYRQTRHIFEVEPREPEIAGELPVSLPVYVVTGEKPPLFRRARLDGRYPAARLVGRADELEQLQNSLRRAIETESVQIVAVVGECGLGKTRLLYEFKRMLGVFPERLLLVKGTAAAGAVPPPYSLLLDMLLNLFGIQRRNSETVLRNRLVEQIVGRLPGEPETARARARRIGALLGFTFSEEELDNPPGWPENPAARLDVYADLAWLFTGDREETAAIVLLLDDLHQADESSLAWLDYLAFSRQDIPLLLVYAVHPSLFARRPSWQTARFPGSVVYRQIDLAPLSNIDSRHLLSSIARPIANFSARLADQIVAGAGGNPLHLEEIVRMLHLTGIIENRENYWLVHKEKLARYTGPLTLAHLLARRLAQLPQTERETLQKAAVLGPVFRPSGLLFLSQEDEQPLTKQSLAAVLSQLVRQEWLYRQRDTRSAGRLLYAFPYEMAREVTSRDTPLAQRQAYHVLAATWFVTTASRQAAQTAGAVAYHFEQADQFDEAAAWYGRAAEQARAQNAPEAAAVYYRRALTLLPDETAAASQRMPWQIGLGHTLCWLGHYDEAAAAFQAARAAANSLSHAATLVDALWGLFLTAYFQADWETALEHAENGAALARDMQLERQQLQMQAAQGMALLHLGKRRAAVSLGQQIYTAAKSLGEREQAYSHLLLGQVGRAMGHYQQAVRAFESARRLFHRLKDPLWLDLLLLESGWLAWEQYNWEAAAHYFQTCLTYARYHHHFYAAVAALRDLGRLASLHERQGEAETSFRQALLLAEKAGSVVHQAWLATDMGLLYLRQAVATPESALELVEKEAHQEIAFFWLEKGLKLARQAQRPLAIIMAVSGLARLFLEDHLLDEAASQAILGVNMAEKSLEKGAGRAVKQTAAVAWRVLGQVLAKTPQKERAAVISGQPVDASACFGRSLQLLDELGEPAALEKLLTLRASALYELHRGHDSRAKSLQRQAARLLRRLGLGQKAWLVKDLTT